MNYQVQIDNWNSVIYKLLYFYVGLRRFILKTVNIDAL